MSRGNAQFVRKGDYELHQKTVTGTHTVKTGTAIYTGLFENPVLITDPAADFTMTVPDGAYVGQTLVIVMTSNTNSKTATVSITHHETSDPEELIHDAADEYTLLLWTGTEWVTVSKTSTTS